MLRTTRYALLLLLFVAVRPTMAVASNSDAPARVQVTCSRASAFVSINISSFRKIGEVVIEVRDQAGRTLYKEEGKALTPELVRRLDKGSFPHGAHTLQVTAKDFAITQVFTIE